MPLPRGLIQFAKDGPTRTVPQPQEFKDWLIGLKFNLAKNNIPVRELPDGTIIAKFGSETRDMSPAMQQENYQVYKDKFYRCFGIKRDGASHCGQSPKKDPCAARKEIPSEKSVPV